jgi:hypothetical protein
LRPNTKTLRMPGPAIEKEIKMRITKAIQICKVLASATLLCGAGAALAQNAPAGAMKTISTPVATKSEVVLSLIVLNSRGATLQGDTLTLTGVMPNSIIFADRPVRAAGHQPTADIIAAVPRKSAP